MLPSHEPPRFDGEQQQPHQRACGDRRQQEVERRREQWAATACRRTRRTRTPVCRTSRRARPCARSLARQPRPPRRTASPAGRPACARRLRQSRSGPTSSTRVRANVSSESDQVARRQRSRVARRSSAETRGRDERSARLAMRSEMCRRLVGAGMAPVSGRRVTTARRVGRLTVSALAARRRSEPPAVSRSAGTTERSAAIVPDAAGARADRTDVDEPRAQRSGGKEIGFGAAKARGGSSEGRPAQASGVPSGANTVSAASLVSPLAAMPSRAAAKRRRGRGLVLGGRACARVPDPQDRRVLARSCCAIWSNGRPDVPFDARAGRRLGDAEEGALQHPTDRGNEQRCSRPRPAASRSNGRTGNGD